MYAFVKFLDFIRYHLRQLLCLILCPHFFDWVMVDGRSSTEARKSLSFSFFFFFVGVGGRGGGGGSAMECMIISIAYLASTVISHLIYLKVFYSHKNH